MRTSSSLSVQLFVCWERVFSSSDKIVMANKVFVQPSRRQQIASFIYIVLCNGKRERARAFLVLLRARENEKKRERYILQRARCKIANWLVGDRSEEKMVQWRKRQSNKEESKEEKTTALSVSNKRKDLLGLPSNHHGSRVARRMGSSLETSCVTTMSTTTGPGWP